MTLTLAALADYATVDRHDKLTIAGIFRTIAAPSYPAIHPSLTIAIQLEPSPQQAHRTMKFVVRIVSPDGTTIPPTMDGTIDIADVPTPAPSLNLLMNLRDLSLPVAGPYLFEIEIDGRKIGELKLDAVRDGGR